MEKPPSLHESARYCPAMPSHSIIARHLLVYEQGPLAPSEVLLLCSYVVPLACAILRPVGWHHAIVTTRRRKWTCTASPARPIFRHRPREGSPSLPPLRLLHLLVLAARWLDFDASPPRVRSFPFPLARHACDHDAHFSGSAPSNRTKSSPLVAFTEHHAAPSWTVAREFLHALPWPSVGVASPPSSFMTSWLRGTIACGFSTTGAIRIWLPSRAAADYAPALKPPRQPRACRPALSAPPGLRSMATYRIVCTVEPVMPLGHDSYCRRGAVIPPKAHRKWTLD